jgi:hypothetical protein
MVRFHILDVHSLDFKNEYEDEFEKKGKYETIDNDNDDNDSVGFMGTGYSQQSLPNYGTSNWICMYWRWQTGSPFYQMSFNDTPGTIRGSLTNSNAYHTRGFGSIGAYHNGNSDPSSSSQPWGDIGLFMCYNRVLSDSELLQNYNATRSKFAY